MNASSVGALENMLGDPCDSANPCGFGQVLAADERGDMLAAGEETLDRFGFGAEFVPAALGGRLHALPSMIELGRAVFRRDPCLGLGYGASSLIAAVNVWSAGSPAQQRTVADLLLRNRKLACAYHELDHGNDLARCDFEALPGADGLVLNGGKQVIANITRADAIIVYARTDTRVGGRSHSQLLVEKRALDGAKTTYPARLSSVGMRGVQLGCIDVNDCALPHESIIGTPGQGLETALKAFQVTRVALPGMFMGILDTGLRSTLRYTRQRQLYGRAVLELPQTRAVVAGAFADLLLADCFVTIAARTLHLIPQAGGVTSAAVKYLVPKLLIDAMTGLSAILGAQFYLRDGRNALFQKLVRDLKPASFGHAARVTCQMTIMPQLPLLARRTWLRDDSPAAPEALFDIGAPLAPFDFATLALGAAGHDPLAAALPAVCAALQAHPQLAVLAQRFTDELARLQAYYVALAPAESSVMASPHSYAQCGCYVTVLAASACLNLWWREQARVGQERDAFLADPRWLEVVLQRLQGRLSGSTAQHDPEHLAFLLAELEARHERAQSFDLTRRPLSAWGANPSSTLQES
ncbi:acyl-CoA dehydrogenase [Massilia sp. CCM 9210]|uniref:acyl-CoA dehydrogenase n=1 Tax=Massilia scottii TaxID=3057166 RepID=UPI0027966A27|nr:acyl-CoA dehydrogenase [Massilia sp. CCM 9210]MDQ1812430.1 acyl-CoA dehydrogenase [Massilia sp. CCM 9210]